jgi:transposase-like protein
MRQVFPNTAERRCWFHKIGNVLNSLPESAQPNAKASLSEIWNAQDKEHATAAAKAFPPCQAVVRHPGAPGVDRGGW